MRYLVGETASFNILMGLHTRAPAKVWAKYVFLAHVFAKPVPSGSRVILLPRIGFPAEICDSM